MIGNDEKPYVWVGHIELGTNDLDASEACFLKVGMRPIFKNKEVSVLELRAGTHLILFAKDGHAGVDATFDLMVEDIDEAHAKMVGDGLNVDEIKRGKIHSSFVLTEPAGNRITENSTHNSGHEV